MAPRQVRLGRTGALPHAIRLSTTDTHSSWILGPGDPVATIRGTAASLLLLLWRRLPAADPAIAWDGDREKAQATLGGALVP
jgi:MDMPI-like protein